MFHVDILENKTEFNAVQNNIYSAMVNQTLEDWVNILATKF